MCGFFNMWVCVCVGFVMCFCVCACVGFLLCGCVDNCVDILAIFVLVFTVFCLISLLYIYSFLFLV